MYLTTKPTDWSDPVLIERQVRFFVTGSGKIPVARGAPREQVRVTAVARKWSQWVRQEFRIKRGEPIGGRAMVQVRNPLTGTVQEVEVDFATGAVAMDFLFDQPIVRKAVDSKTFVLVYLDADGRMKSRFQAWDRTSPLLK
jgi:hypothetical protein